MKIDNLHQPYIFNNVDNKINIIVSEYTPNILTFNYGEYTSTEDGWKLHLLDENYNKTIINTPKTISHNGYVFDVIAECNGYIDGDNISYVIGGFSEKASLYTHFLVTGKYNFTTNSVSNLEYLENHRTGFYKNMDIYSIFINTKLFKNTIELFDFKDHVLGITRIIPMYGHNKILVTGTIVTEIKTISHITLVYNVDSNSVTKLQTSDTDRVYKSSIYDYNNVKLMVYTDKMFNSNNSFKSQLTQTNSDYTLNVESDFILTEI